MPQRPAPPPWGALLTRGLVRAKLSAREAARRAGISEGRWRQIAGGYQVVSAGVYAPVRGPAPTLARMAAVVGVTPAQLRKAGRPDAARALAAGPGDADVADELLQRVRRMNSDQARELLVTIALELGLRLQERSANEDRSDHAGLAACSDRFRAPG